MPEQQNSQDEKNVIHLDEAQNGADSSTNLKDKLKDSLQKLDSLKERFSSVSGAVGGFFGKIPPLIAKIKELFKNKIILYATIAVAVLLLILIVVIIIALNKEEPLAPIYSTQPLPEQRAVREGTKMPKIEGSELQNLIQKAALLYSSGHIVEALDVYNNISLFSQSFASFNLGVAKMKEPNISDKNLKDALSAFDGTISSGENIAAAAINAAQISYRLGDFGKYDYYVNLAKGTMIEWSGKPLYSYLYTLANFYSANYFNALSSLNNPSSDAYPTQSALLASKIYLNFGDEYNALKKLLDITDMDNRFTIGLIYARMGEFDLAYQYISNFVRDLDSPNSAMALQTNMALALVELKRSHFTQSAEIYNALMKNNEAKDLVKFYPIKIKLKDSLFDINIAQKSFWNRSDNAQLTNLWHYKIIFYFAPFRVFDAKNAIALINDGGLHLRMNNLEEAESSLASGVMLSKINQNITQGLKEILRYNINEALNIMRDATKKYPNHQVLQYNLGLIYAQLNDFENARRHFLRAYHLDSNDLLSGIFALMSSQLVQKDGSRILNDITQSLEEIRFDSPMQEGFYRSLLGFANGNLTDDMQWFHSNEEATLSEIQAQQTQIMAQKAQIQAQNPRATPLMFALNALYALGTRDKNIIEGAFNELVVASNNDIVAMILAKISSHFNENIKAFSLNLFDFFKNDLRNLELVYTGPSLARQIYIYMAFLVGANSYVDEILNDRLLNNNGDDISGILQALALNAIYLLDFERAFAYYNELIDTYKVQSSEIYFYATVAAIGAGNYDNAVALIQLSRMDNGTNFEARYALGLLHQAMGNLNLASMQFGAITKAGFKSDFFDFEIDTDEILAKNNATARNAPNPVGLSRGNYANPPHLSVNPNDNRANLLELDSTNITNPTNPSIVNDTNRIDSKGAQ